jgi:hypothetical protein
LERSNEEVNDGDAGQVGVGEEGEDGRGDAGGWGEQGVAGGEEILDDAGAVAEEGEVDFQHGVCGGGWSAWLVVLVERRRKKGAGNEGAASVG